MGSSGRRVRRWRPLLATIALAGGACLTLHAADAPDPNRELHEAARSYYLAVQASVNDLDRALLLLNDAADHLHYVTGDPTLQAIAGELDSNVRNATLMLRARHERLVNLSREVTQFLDHHDPRGALDRLSTVPRCLPGGAPPSPTEISDRDCQPTSDAHFDLDGLHHRAQQDLTASHSFTGFVRQWFGNQ